MTISQPHHPPSLSELVAVIEEAFPELTGFVAPLTMLGKGYHSVAVETSGGLVFRFPKMEEAARNQLIENRLLPELGTTLPVQIPLPSLHATASIQCPWGFNGYLKIPGVIVTDLPDYQEALPHLASQVAGFLVALHNFPADRALALSVPDNASWLENFQKMHGFLLKELQSRLLPSELSRVNEWWLAFVKIAEVWSFTQVLTHNDLGPVHALVQPETLTLSGIIDFGDTTVGDPALDFAGLLAWGNEEFMLRVAESYHDLGGPADSDVAHRARLLAETNVFLDVVHALTLGHYGPPIPTIDQAVGWLRSGTVLSRDPAPGF